VRAGGLRKGSVSYCSIEKVWLLGTCHFLRHKMRTKLTQERGERRKWGWRGSRLDYVLFSSKDGWEGRRKEDGVEARGGGGWG